MSGEVWTLVAVAVAYLLIYAIGEVGRKAAGKLGWWAIALIPVSVAMTAANGWMVMVLWNLSVPDLFGLPQLSLVPAIALSWFAGIIIRGTGPRAMYDVDADR